MANLRPYTPGTKRKNSKGDAVPRMIRRAYDLRRKVELDLGIRLNNNVAPWKKKVVHATPCKWIIDSGAGLDTVSRKDLSRLGGAEIKQAAKPLNLRTAGGEVRADKAAVVEVERQCMKTEVTVLDDCPSVLRLGRMCMEEGYSFHWDAFGRPCLVSPSGCTTELDVENFVPVLPIAAEPGDTGTGGTLSSDIRPMRFGGHSDGRRP